MRDLVDISAKQALHVRDEYSCTPNISRFVRPERHFAFTPTSVMTTGRVTPTVRHTKYRPHSGCFSFLKAQCGQYSAQTLPNAGWAEVERVSCAVLEGNSYSQYYRPALHSEALRQFREQIATFGRHGRHLGSGELSTGELFERYEVLKAIASTRELSSLETREMSEIERQLDEREFLDESSSAALKHIESDLSKLERIEKITSLLASLSK